jgi:hypothetical protein
MDLPKRDPALRRIVVAIAGASIVFCVVVIVVYYWIAGVAVHGWMLGGPVMLTGAMAGLFAGGLAAMVALILLLRRH